MFLTYCSTTTTTSNQPYWNDTTKPSKLSVHRTPLPKALNTLKLCFPSSNNAVLHLQVLLYHCRSQILLAMSTAFTLTFCIPHFTLLQTTPFRRAFYIFVVELPYVSLYLTTYLAVKPIFPRCTSKQIIQERILSSKGSTLVCPYIKNFSLI